MVRCSTRSPPSRPGCRSHRGRRPPSGTGTSTRQGKKSAAVARADVPDIAQAGVLTSDSEATHTDQKSTGTAITDGFQLGILDAIKLVLLHSEVSSEGGGSSYLVGLNGMEIGTDGPFGATPLCALTAPGLLSLSCLTSSGGSGSTGSVTEAASQVAGITPALSALSIIDPVSALSTSATAPDGRVRRGRRSGGHRPGPAGGDRNQPGHSP